MKDDLFYLKYIRECIAKISQYVGDVDVDRFRSDTLIQDAVLRNLQIMAESTQRLSETLKNANPQVEWRNIAAFRNVLVHGYLGIDVDVIWDAIQHDLPTLKLNVLAILADHEQTDKEDDS